VATASASLPVAWRLYLPEAWAADSERRAKAGVPEEVTFRTKPQIALSQIQAALREGVAPGTVLADGGHYQTLLLRQPRPTSQPSRGLHKCLQLRTAFEDSQGPHTL